MSIAVDDRTEWLETDGLGGFASGTTGGVRTRRYHSLLVSATEPPTGRFALVNGLDVTLSTPEGDIPISFNRYAPDVTTGTDVARVECYSNDPWPRWVIRLHDGTRIAHELFIAKAGARTVVTWRLLTARAGVTLHVRPLLSGRDYHALHHENEALRFDASVDGVCVRWRPYRGVPGVAAHHSGAYRHAPAWYRRFQYDRERERGFECVEDLASPGVFDFDLSGSEAALVFTAEPGMEQTAPLEGSVGGMVSALRSSETRRRAVLGSLLARSADAYIVKRGEGKTIIAGYPWFADWGRDTFIALRGLCLATGRLDDARSILLAWADADSRGVLPNRFPDRGGTPEYNSVDASLWFIIAAHELMEHARARGHRLLDSDRESLRRATQRILSAYADGTHHGIRMDGDGLLACGAPGVQLTWMDARVGTRVVTPRVGKPVEVQALWLNALRIGALWAPRWIDPFEQGMESFRDRFWNEAEGCLYDVVDVDHAPGVNDGSVRPNQLLAAGGVPLVVLDRERARRIVETVEARLMTPLGPRSLAPGHADYAPRYAGGPEERDAVYHQGTVWPWLLGPFVEAWVRARGDTAPVRAEARARFLEPVLRHLDGAGVGHVSEVADAEAPHTPGGCPFQAWSIGELIRLDRVVLASTAGEERPVAVVTTRGPTRDRVAV